jgi:hypothetical protein
VSGNLRDYWTFFAEDSARTSGTELYPRFARGVGNDDELKSIASHVKAGQPQANILFGAVHFLLLRGAEHPLRKFYASLGGTAQAADEDPFPLFRDFVLTHRGEIAPLVRTRVTNTNEVGRSALLHAGFRAVAAEAGAPLNLVEIGPSAGLNLIWDRYGVRYMKDGAVVAAIAPDAKLVLDCEARGDVLPPTGPAPKVGSRLGLELNPVDLGNRDDRDWLRALVWPDDVARLRRLEKALELFAEAKPEIRAGDALALLPDALAAIPRDGVACVYHTIALYQFSREMKEALDAILTIAGLRRPVHRLSFEPDGTEYRLSLIGYHDGVRTERVLANSHPHGRWIEWRA